MKYGLYFIIAALLFSCFKDDDEKSKTFSMTISGRKILVNSTSNDTIPLTEENIHSWKYARSVDTANYPNQFDTIKYPDDFRTLTIDEDGTAHFVQMLFTTEIMGDTLKLIQKGFEADYSYSDNYLEDDRIILYLIKGENGKYVMRSLNSGGAAVKDGSLWFGEILSDTRVDTIINNYLYPYKDDYITDPDTISIAVISQKRDYIDDAFFTYTKE